jgi:hypothetical protein
MELAEIVIVLVPACFPGQPSHSSGARRPPAAGGRRQDNACKEHECC